MIALLKKLSSPYKKGNFFTEYMYLQYFGVFQFVVINIKRNSIHFLNLYNLQLSKTNSIQPSPVFKKTKNV